MSLMDSREAESRGRTSTNLRSVSGGTRICLGAFPGPFPFPSPNRDLSFPHSSVPCSLPSRAPFLFVCTSFSRGPLLATSSFLPSSLSPSPHPSLHPLSLFGCVYISVYIGLKRRTRARSRFTVRWTVKRLISPPSQIGKRPFSASSRKSERERKRERERERERKRAGGETAWSRPQRLDWWLAATTRVEEAAAKA